MHGYTKLFGSIVASTIWREDDKTRIVWITMLALKNREGVVEASVPGLSDLAKVTLEDTLKALEKLSAPDQYSRSKEFEGRRIREVDGGWLILNADKYRDKMNKDDRREYLRIKQQEHRDRVKAKEAVEPRKLFTKPTTEELSSYANEIGLPSSELMKFHDHYESNGWRVGKNPMKSWQAAMRNWKNNGRNYQTDLLAPIDKSILQGEYDRVLKRVETLRSTYGSMQTWSAEDKQELAKLKVRRDELRVKLGITI